MTREKKFTNSVKITDYEVLSDEGFVDIDFLHTTIPYIVYNVRLTDGTILRCADNHILFKADYSEIFVKDLKPNDKIIIYDETHDDVYGVVEYVEVTNKTEEMFDLELSSYTKHRYFTNNILSHNTEMSKIISDTWYGKDMIRIDMSEYQEKHSLSGLVGTQPGYVGYEKGGNLTNMVRQNPYSLILFDEIEKAHKDILNVLLQILDEGFVTDGQGRKVDFRNTIIIMTSNLGSKNSETKKAGYGGGRTIDLKDSSIAFAKEHFTPELWNRIDQIVVFNPLTKDDMLKILDLELSTFIKILSDKGINLIVNSKMKDKILELGFDSKLGARPLKRAIQEHLIDTVADYILEYDNDTQLKKVIVDWDLKSDKVSIKGV